MRDSGDSGDLIFTKRLDGSLEFRGDFEALYQADPDPWGQSGHHPRMANYYAASRMRLVEALSDIRWCSALEVGCGAGYVVRLLARMFGNRRLAGIDISPTAVELALALCPGLKFSVGDFGDPGLVSDSDEKLDVVILGQVLWYILDRLPAVLENSLAVLAPHGHLIIQMAFLEKQVYGREIVDGFNGLLRYMLRYERERQADLRVVLARYDASSRHTPYHDGLLVLEASR